MDDDGRCGDEAARETARPRPVRGGVDDKDDGEGDGEGVGVGVGVAWGAAARAAWGRALSGAVAAVGLGADGVRATAVSGGVPRVAGRSPVALVERVGAAGVACREIPAGAAGLLMSGAGVAWRWSVLAGAGAGAGVRDVLGDAGGVDDGLPDGAAGERSTDGGAAMPGAAEPGVDVGAVADLCAVPPEGVRATVSAASSAGVRATEWADAAPSAEPATCLPRNVRATRPGHDEPADGATGVPAGAPEEGVR